MTDLINSNLPKWPQMLVSGIPVTLDQAMDIIFRTDNFLTSEYEFSGGNAHEFNNMYREFAGLNTLHRKFLGDDNNQDLKRYHEMYNAIDKLRTHLGVISTEYVHNSWASCAYIFGPHGWCHPNGTILYSDNIGKYPSVEEVLNDWNILSQAFPYLDLHVTLMSGENGEDHSKPVVNIRVVKGIATLQEPDMHPHAINSKSEITQDLVTKLMGNPVNHECGLDNDWYEYYAQKVNKAIQDLGLLE